MSEPFIGEISIFAFNFPPRGWAQCDGQILPIAQNQSLFSLLGTTFGGDGRTTFALPDLRGRVPIHEGISHTLGERGGEAEHFLSSAEMPGHAHVLRGSSTAGNTPVPINSVFASNAAANYGTPTNLVATDASTVLPVGGQAHSNFQPYLVVNFCIALQGIFPSRN